MGSFAVDLFRLSSLILLLVLPGAAARADPAPKRSVPLDLRDATPRWIDVRFETSPADAPGALDGRWSPSRRAWLEPVAPSDSTRSSAMRAVDTDATGAIRPRVFRIQIPAAEIEAQLRSTGTEVVPGSFSDFVWQLDRETGHVIRAELTGRVRERLRLGPFRSSARIDIRVEMSTAAAAGYEPGHGILGIPTNRFCPPDALRPGCVRVSPVAFDRTRGYVNAVGSVRAATPLAEIVAFSPLGEVELLERRQLMPRAPGEGGVASEIGISGPRAAESVISGASPAEDVCSVTFSGPCRTDLGGES